MKNGQSGNNGAEVSDQEVKTTKQEVVFIWCFIYFIFFYLIVIDMYSAVLLFDLSFCLMKCSTSQHRI